MKPVSLTLSLSVALLCSPVLLARPDVVIDQEHSIKLLDRSIEELNHIQGKIEADRGRKKRKMIRKIERIKDDLRRLRKDVTEAKSVHHRKKMRMHAGAEGAEVKVLIGSGHPGSVRDRTQGPVGAVVVVDPASQMGPRPGRGNVRPMGKRRWANLKTAIKGESFADGRLRVLRSACQDGYFLVGQVKQLLDLYSFGDDKLKALEILAPQILDRENSFQLYQAFEFDGERDQARAILQR